INKWCLMAALAHEVWEEFSDGMVLHTCCLAGPPGDRCREQLAPEARLLTTFEATSHFEAMKIYHSYLGRAGYITNQASDHEPYPDEWLAEQQFSVRDPQR